MNVRRRSSAAALAAIAVIGAATAPAVAADPSPSASAPPSTPSGLYGTADPQYDGVWRQSLALLAQDTAGVVPSSKAVKWLTGQQCANGAFGPFRADPAKACDAKTMVDTNSTAAAVQALWAVGGHGDVVEDALGWLKSVQNKDGGWGYSPGTPSDANSTSVVVGALTATETNPEDVRKGGKSPYDALLTFALPCAKDKGAGAFAFQPDKDGKLLPNADATAAGVLGSLGKGLVTEAGSGAKSKAATCSDADEPTREQAAANGAAYLADTLAKDGHLVSALGGSADQPDYGNTADAVVALAAQGGADQAAESLAWLEKNAAKWAAESGPAAYAQLIFAAHATGTDPRAFGGTDLVEKLNATGPAPQGTTAKDTATASDDDKAQKKDDDSPFGVWWFVGVCLVFGIGVGFLLSNRNKKQQL